MGFDATHRRRIQFLSSPRLQNASSLGEAQRRGSK